MSAPNPAKRKFAVIVTVLSLLLITIVVWSVHAYRQSGFQSTEIFLQGIILLALLAFMVPYLLRLRDEISRGLPIEDERSKRNKVLAGYYSFLVSIYLWLAIMYFEKYFTVNSAVAAAILGASVTFGLSYVYLSRKP